MINKFTIGFADYRRTLKYLQKLFSNMQNYYIKRIILHYVRNVCLILCFSATESN